MNIHLSCTSFPFRCELLDNNCLFVGPSWWRWARFGSWRFRYSAKFLVMFTPQYFWMNLWQNTTRRNCDMLQKLHTSNRPVKQHKCQDTKDRGTTYRF